jgi:hypothetical protein
VARKFVPRVDGLEPRWLRRVGGTGIQALPLATPIPVTTVLPTIVTSPNSPSTPPFVPDTPQYTPTLPSTPAAGSNNGGLTTGSQATGGQTSGGQTSGGQPTPAEIARERYGSSFVGPISVGPALFTNESRRIYIQGVGFSTQFLHGNIQMAIILPNSPGQPIYGGAYVQDQNLAGANAIGLDLVFDPNSVGARGLPTVGAWSTDPNVYSGPDFVAKGSGTFLVRYAGRYAYVVFKGSMYTNGLTNPLGNTNLQP